MWGLLKSGDFLGEVYPVAPNGSYDPVIQARYAGERNLAHRWYLTLLRYDPEKTLLMMRENDPDLKAAEKRRR